LLESLKERNFSGNVSVDGRIMLKYILEAWCLGKRFGTGDGALWWNFDFYKVGGGGFRDNLSVQLCFQ
jgi:hypothetical protein